MNTLPAKASGYYVQQAQTHTDQIRSKVRMTSAVLTAQCKSAGLPIELAEVCGGLLASVIDDLRTVSDLPRSSFERTKRKERILEAAQEPYASAMRIAIAASPLNGRAAVAHWDAICEKYEIGKLAWLMCMDTDTSWRYGRKLEKQRA